MTVAELIDALRRFDSQKVVVIRDADTGWWLNVAAVEEETDDRVAGVVALVGGYGDEYEPKR